MSDYIPVVGYIKVSKECVKRKATEGIWYIRKTRNDVAICLKAELEKPQKWFFNLLKKAPDYERYYDLLKLSFSVYKEEEQILQDLIFLADFESDDKYIYLSAENLKVLEKCHA